MTTPETQHCPADEQRSLSATIETSRRLADAALVRDHLRTYAAGMRAQATPANTLTLDDVQAKVRDAEVDYAGAYIADLFTRHGITDPTQAHRLLRERCTDTELGTSRDCLTLLDGQGVLG